jgi:hypothetical protein
VPTFIEFDLSSALTHTIGANGSCKCKISNFSSARISPTWAGNHGDIGTRAMAPAYGIGRGLPTGVTSSSK